MTFAVGGIFVSLLLYLLSANEELTRSAQLIAKENAVLTLIVDSETGMRGFLVTGNADFLAPRIRSQSELPKRLAELKTAFVGDSAQSVALDKMSVQYAEWDGYASKAITTRLTTGRLKLSNAELRKDLMDKVREDFAELRASSERVRDEHADAAKTNTRFGLTLIIFISLILGGALAFMGRSQLLSLSRQYDEILASQSAQNEELKRQAWLRDGQAGLAKAVRGDHSVAVLSSIVVSYLAEFIGAKIGALFVVGNKGGLDRTGGYALPGGGPLHFQAGDGLIGRAAQSMEVQTIHDVPENYMRLASGLGEASPRHLLIAPLTADGQLQGVIEFGLLEIPSERAIELLRGVSELAGVALRSATYRVRLQDLLNESQQLTEELQAQQEELRVSNEELSERSHALQESTTRLESQQSELEQTNEQLEEQAQALETQRNDLDRQNTDLIIARGDLQEKAEQLETASRYKSEFLANMSHELRTPLNSTLILAKLLQDNASGNLSEEQVHFASTIYDAGNDLLALINDILDLSKVEAGKLDLNIEKIPMPKIAQSLERIFKPLADTKALRFEVKVNPAVTAITTDRQRLEQILRNLLSNAVKFTSEGSVILEIVPEGQEQIRFTIRDTGIGIDPSQHRQIFDAFHQADGTISRKYGGTGLGLSISKSLAELLGGYLEVSSSRGEGSSFSLLLPIEKLEATKSGPKTGNEERRGPGPAMAPPSATPPQRRPGDKLSLPKKTEDVSPANAFYGFPDDRENLTPKDKRILLVVEDEPQFAKVLLDLGRELDFKVILAGTTTDGYALVLRYIPSAVILDMKLPDASGLTLLDRLKENPITRHIPVHGISATDFSREALHLGAIGFLMKPADRSALKATLEKLEQTNLQRLKNVLIVEDDRVQRESIEKLIGDPSVKITSLETGEEALAALSKSTFDCMIMDIRLPDMSGFQLLESMASDHEHAFPPVIVYTGQDLSREEEARLRRYSRSIIIKGARSPERLLDEVALFLHQVESSLSPERQKLIQSARSREKAFDGRRILLVDDDVRNIFALTSALENKGVKVQIARNGREAVEQIENSLKQSAPLDLVLMDIMMPEMDGYEAITKIREQKQFKDLPIIAITAKAMRDDYEKCLEVGANDYLAKPIDLDRLVSLMRVWLPKQVGRV